MKLHELHIPQRAACAECDGVTVGRGDLRIGRLAIKCSGTAGAENRLLGPDKRATMIRVPDEGTTADSVMREQIQRKRLRPEIDMRSLGRATVHGPHDFLSGGITERVGDSRMAVTALQSQRQLAVDFVEFRAVRNQFANSLRGFADHQFHDLRMAQPFACGNRVGDVTGEIIERPQNSGNAPLSVRTVRMLQ